jgi:Tol biopolymer transport system component/predicted Ser/Thr protein kinase
MNDHSLRRVEDLFHQASELAPDARSAFLDQACGVDEALRREVESLLAHDPENGNTFAGLVQDDAPQSIAHYRISGKLGQGGMGAVYRATDTKLGREVAIKVLPLSFAEDADRVARFTREAKVLASLNHPNIAQIYGIEERALVMELVPGATLQRPLPLETALNYARQIAEALEAAHERGIVHRDLKPANIVVTPEGVVKLLDFGLAAIAPVAGDPLSSPTITMQTAQSGVIMGTAAYMSPEQAAGKPVDKRADVWSFGVVLWELLTGRRLFEGDTISVTLAGVLRGPIDFDQLPRDTPASIRSLLRRCLDRDVKNRLRDIGEARVAIDALDGEMLALEGAPEQPPRRPWMAWTAAAALAAALAAVAYVHFREKPPAPATPVRLEIPAPEDATPLMKLSPDGRKLAFLAGGRLWVHYLDTGESRDLTGNQGVPFWSPDSRFIGYALPHKVLKIEATGGPPQTVAERGALWGGGTWNRDDTIVFAGRLAGIFRVPASGGVPVQIVAPDANHQQFGPTFLPDGRHFLYTRTASDLTNGAIYLGSIDSKPEQQNSTPLAPSDAQPEYAPSADPNLGRLLFVRNGALLAQLFDNHRLKLQGQAAAIADHVWTIRDLIALGAYTYVSASANDVLVFRQRSLAAGRRLYRLTLLDRKGNDAGSIGEPASFGASAAFSPDGKRVALTIDDLASSPPTTDIWIADLARGSRTRLTFGPGTSENPVWSADGRRVIFRRSGKIYWKAVDGTGEEEALLTTVVNPSPTSVSPDGRYLLFDVSAGQNGSDIWVLPLTGDRKPFPFLNTPANEHLGAFSPDGRWVAYRSNETGPMEVYVRPFPPSSGGKWPISKGGAWSGPRWRKDGKELGYSASDGSVMSVPITSDPVFRAGVPEALFKTPPRALPHSSFPDRSRFLFAVPIDAASTPAPFNVVLNWTALLKP